MATYCAVHRHTLTHAECGHVAVRPRACVDVQHRMYRMQCEPGLRLETALN